MTRVCVVMNHLINVKYIICPLAASPASPTGNADENLVKNERNVEHEKNRKFITHTESSLSPSLVSRKSGCFPVNGKYPVQSALQILQKMEDPGIGTLREIIHPYIQ